MKRLKFIPLFRHNRALSYTVSAMLITGTTILLVLIASIYAYQILEQQRGIAEFDVAQKSILSFNDALENAAWKLGASRSTRFTVQYGFLELSPNAYSVEINTTLGGTVRQISNLTFPGSSGKVTYYLSTKYTSLGDSYSSYILGNNTNILVGNAENYGRAVVRQEGSWASILLDYRVRAMRTSVVYVDGRDVNYVDIWVIKVKMLVTQPWSYINDFDLKAKCTSIKTATYGPYAVNGIPNAVVSVRIGSTTDSGVIPVVTTSQSQAVFNVVVAEVQVYV